MTDHVDQLVEALRIELQHYGEMLALLDAQETANHRGLPAVLNAFETIQRHGSVIDEARTRRLQLHSQLAWSVSQPQKDRLADLIPDLPPDYQPLLGALNGEIEHLITRVSERARESHSQLNAAVIQMERFIRSISAAPQTATSSPTAQSATA